MLTFININFPAEKEVIVMKKFLSILGGIIAAASILTAIAVILKKIKLSFSIEYSDDDLFENDENEKDISVTVEDEKDDGNIEIDIPLDESPEIE